MGGDRVAAFGRRHVAVAPPGDRLVEEAEIVGRLDIVAERLQRPDDDVAVAVAVADMGVGLEHEPLRPVAAVLVLLGEDDREDLAHRRSCSERQQELDRPLADVARAPGGAAVLLEPVRHGQVDHRVWASQGSSASSAATTSASPRRRRSRVTWLQKRAAAARAAASSTPPGIAVGERSRPRRGRSSDADDGESEGRGRLRPECDEAAAASDAVGVEKLVAADRLDRLGRARDQMVDGLRIALAPERGRVRAEGESLCRAASISTRPA